MMTILIKPSPIMMQYLRKVESYGLYRIECVPEKGHVIAIRKRAAQLLLLEYPGTLDLTAFDPSSTIEMLISTKLWLTPGGPKAVILRQRDAEALENTAPRFAIGEYKQPFPTMMVRLPNQYVQNKVTACDFGGEHQPGAVVLHHENGALFAAVYFTSNQTITMHLDSVSPTELLSDIIDDCLDRVNLSSASVSDGEKGIARDCVRIALNTFYLLSANGYVDNGPEDPKRYAKCADRIKRGKHIAINTYDQIMFHYYGFEPGFVFYRVSRVGGTVRPHWRSGHVRNQRYGPGLSQSKVIWIHPVWVNGD